MPFQAYFGGFAFDTQPFDGGLSTLTTYSSDLVVFDGYSLSDNSATFCLNLLDSAPNREILGGKIPRFDGQYVTADYWREKTVEVQGVLKASTNALLETAMDAMRQSLRGREKSLDVTRNGVAKRYVATLTNPEDLFADRKGYHVTFVPFTARFACKTPFGKDRAYTSTTQTLTASPTTFNFVNAGTYKAYPVITLIFDAASSVTLVDLLNTSAGGVTDELQYSGSIAAGDILVFDCEAKTVTKNAAGVDYSGNFFAFDVSSNSLKVTVTASSFRAVTTVSYKSAWL